MQGTTIRETEKAILFRVNADDLSPFAGSELWWPVSQVNYFPAADGFDARVIPSTYIARQKGAELQKAAAVEQWFRDCDESERAEREERKAKRAGRKAGKRLRELMASGVSERNAFIEVYGNYRTMVDGQWVELTTKE